MIPSTLALAEHLVRQLRDSRWTLGIGESCTGGLLSAYLTHAPGVSAVITHGFLCYSNLAKQDLLGVEQDVMVEYGSVSEPVAIQMAEGAAAAARADVGLGMTGIAGPTGGSLEKPVGTVFAAVSVHGTTQSRSWHFDGNRARVREESVKGFLTFANQAIKSVKQLQGF